MEPEARSDTAGQGTEARGSGGHDAEVLVIGAGPTGLTLALALARAGIAVRIVDEGEGPSVHSKALVVQPRTLETLERLGVAGDLVRGAAPLQGIAPHIGRRRLFTLRFEPLDGPFDRPLFISQVRTEAALLQALTQAGVTVERRTRLETFVQTGGGVRATLEGPDGPVEVHARFLAGCDGARSRVRAVLDLPFEGTSYDNDFRQVDARIEWPEPVREARGYLLPKAVVAILPVDDHSHRIVCFRERAPEGAPEEPVVEEFQQALDGLVPGARIVEPIWLARFRLHERVVPRMRVDEVFLAGDAAHIHTPAGGQGMNTGIQDAENLAWKLAMVVQGAGDEALLDSYHAERHPIAVDTLAFTERLFQTVFSLPAPVRALRAVLLPLVGNTGFIRRRIFRRVAQLGLNVRGSPIVHDDLGGAAGPRAGDRAPDAVVHHEGEQSRLFAHFRGTSHLALVFPRAGEEAAARALLAELVPTGTRGVIVVAPGSPVAGEADVLVDESGEARRRYRARRRRIFLVRPDGIIALRTDRFDAEALARRSWVMRPAA
jgi:2-polyprenyl-6-methoxyphenol hydroxylase-like FAD-dependent oxidoreductase